MSPSSVRPAAVACQFYPADAAVLRRQIGQALAAVPAPEAGTVPPKMLVVPHAGYVYSGPIAAHAYRRLVPLAQRIRRVVLLGPVHRVPVRGLALPQARAFDTPLGRIEVDAEAAAAIAGLPQVVVSDRPHALEHSLEVQLPLLQSVLGRFTLLPLAVGDATPAEVAEVLERLWGGEETLVVVSTDLSHYLAYDEAREADAATVERVLAGQATLTPHQACGAHPLNGALLAARRHGLQAQLLDLRNSGDTAGDRRRVVGYAAFAFAPPAPPAADEDDEEHEEADASLGPALTAAARNAIGRELGVAAVPEPGHAALARPGASFVTLHDAQGELRGCIGRLEAVRPLGADVRANARAAAFEDPRFAPVAAHEWGALQLEVSVLSAAQPITVRHEQHALELLRPQVDGVILEWRGRRATFLPQVWAQLPEPAQFLAALKRKAGLAPDFWQPDLRLSRYRVRAYEEQP